MEIVPKIVPTRSPRKIFIAVAVISGPREPIMLPNVTTNAVSSQTLGYDFSSQSRPMPMIDRA
ncbi:Uncharacterised protein [Mycobacterium tuberculosis]|nr:Uncharacterised protein [Mycobacterium tuberculosis]